MSDSELESIYRKPVNRSGIHRCSICNKVNTETIATELGDYDPREYFTNDPKDPSHFICITCEEAIQEIRDDYQLLYGEEDD